MQINNDEWINFFDQEFDIVINDNNQHIQEEESEEKLQEKFQFINLPDLIKLQIISMLDKDSLLNLSLVCWRLNRMASSVIKKRLTLSLQLLTSQDREAKSVANMFAAILENESNGRRYSKMVLKNIEWALNTDFLSLVLYAFSVVGCSVGELVICETTFSSLEKGFQVLQCFRYIKNLTLTAVNVYLMSDINFNEILPHLKKLEIDKTSPKAISWFKHCCELETFVFDLDEIDRNEFRNHSSALEEFLLQQNSLKFLNLNNLLSIGLFENDRSKDVKFQLEEIVLSDTFFINQENALKFFKTQNEVKQLDVFSTYDEDFENFFMEIIKFMYGLPTLKKLTVCQGVNDATNFPINASLKILEFSHHVSCEVIKSMMKIFPGLENIHLESTFLKLEDFPVGQLYKLKVSNTNSLIDFRYHLSDVANVNQNNFEILMKCFLMRNRKIERLAIGNSTWIENNFGLTFRFCKDLLNFLPELTTLELYNPSEIKHLVMLLTCQRRKFVSIKLYTNEIGYNLVKRMKKSCLQVIAV